MADNLHKRPSKGILKNSSSFDRQESHASHQPRKSIKETKWDEMNIIATLHPADKDYGFMKIDEPKTPYNYASTDEADQLDAAALAEKMKIGAKSPPKALVEAIDESDDEDDDDLTPEARAKKREFENKRKKHYNEYYAVKLARKLLEEADSDSDSASHDQSTSNRPK